MAPGCITVFAIWMSDGNQLPPAGETACPTYFAKRLIQQGGAGGFACRSNGHNQWSAAKNVTHPSAASTRVEALFRVDAAFVAKNPRGAIQLAIHSDKGLPGGCLSSGASRP